MQSPEVGRSLACSSRKEARVSGIWGWAWGLGYWVGGMQLEQEAKDRPHWTSCTRDSSSKNGLYLQWTGWKVLSWRGPQSVWLLCRE